jgi:hypothetical protein
MNASVTMRQAGQSKKMAEAQLSFEERKTITILIQLFSFLKMCIHFLSPSVHVSILLIILKITSNVSTYIYI